VFRMTKQISLESEAEENILRRLVLSSEMTRLIALEYDVTLNRREILTYFIICSHTGDAVLAHRVNRVY
jgi:uncharacterized membrane protein